MKETPDLHICYVPMPPPGAAQPKPSEQWACPDCGQQFVFARGGYWMLKSPLRWERPVPVEDHNE